MRRSDGRDYRPYVAACVIVLLVFTAFQAVRPYFFNQDDNRDSFLPLFVHNYRAAADGQLAQFNFFQSLGRPHLASGWPAVLLPTPYIAIFLSKVLFGHVFAAIDIMTLIYLLLGAAGTVFLLRLWGASDAAAVFAAAAWVFSPFNVMTSQSWATYSPIVGLLPWIVAGTLLVQRRRFAAGGAIFVIAHVLVFYVGAPQFFLYAAVLEGLMLVWVSVADLWSKRTTLGELLRVTGVFLLLTVLVMALCMPLFLPMWDQMQSSAFRGESLSFGELTVCTISRIQLVNGLFYPFKRFAIPPNGQWCETYLPASFTHQGYLATLLLLLFPWARRRVPREHRRYFDGAFATGVLFLLAALGALTWITAEIPIVNRLRWPFKYFGFGNFPLMLSTAPAFDAIVQWRKSATGQSRLGIALIALQVFNLAALDLSFPRQAFVEHLDPLPLEEPLRPMLANTRMVSVGCVRAEKLRTVASLGYDYATLWELHHFGGYDPLVPYQNYQLTLGLDYQAALCKEPALVPVGYLRQWGVRYYILKEPPANWYAPTLLKWGMRRVHSDRDRIVLQDPAAAPLAGGPGCALQHLGRRGDDLTAVMACSADSLVTLRFLFDPRFTVTVDGVLSKAIETETNQLSVAVPRGVHEIRVAFDDPRLDEGLWIALFALVIVTGFVLLRAVRRRPASAPPHKAAPPEPGS